MINQQSNEHKLELDPSSQATEQQQEQQKEREQTVSMENESEKKCKLHKETIYKKIATLLRAAYDTEDWRDTDSDFVDSLERVFHQINIPSAANLHQFICKMQAIKRHQSKQAQQMTGSNSSTTSTAEDQ